MTTCANCGRPPTVLGVSVRRNQKRNNGKFICRSCKIKTGPTRPQNQKGFWSKPELKEKLRNSMLNSLAFAESRKVVSAKLTGAGNPKFGKKVSSETRDKMSKSRIGKLGENATAWKGGKQSLNNQIKSLVNKRHKWSKRVFERDGWVCTSCGSKKNLDAHHITPFSVLLKEVITTTILEGDNLINYLANHPVLTDADGTTLCRSCHREIHRNWGSHYSEVQNVNIQK